MGILTYHEKGRQPSFSFFVGKKRGKKSGRIKGEERSIIYESNERCGLEKAHDPSRRAAQMRGICEFRQCITG